MIFLIALNLIAIIIGVVAYIKNKDEIEFIDRRNRETELAEEKYEIDIVEEICRFSTMVRSIMNPAKRLTWAEKHILMAKLIHGKGAFPVEYKPKKSLIKKWLREPAFNRPMPDNIIVKAASKSSIDMKAIRKILKKACGRDYTTYKNMAEHKILGIFTESEIWVLEDKKNGEYKADDVGGDEWWYEKNDPWGCGHCKYGFLPLKCREYLEVGVACPIIEPMDRYQEIQRQQYFDIPFD